MRYSLFDLRNIQNKEIREYFSEVLTCYENESYRSSILVLYTVILYDLVFKLKELGDEYEDSHAIQILDAVENAMSQNSDKSAWENLLIEKLHEHEDFEILDDNLYSTIKAIKDKRNLSAHPSFQGTDTIFQPRRELVLGFIAEIYENLLIVPSILMSRNLDKIQEFFKERKSEFNHNNFYLNDNNSKYFFNHFSNKFYSRMSKPLKLKFFKSLWNMTFEKDLDDSSYIFLHLAVLKKIYSEDRVLYEAVIDEKMNQGKISDCIKLPNNGIFNEFIIFLCFFPELFEKLSLEEKNKIKEEYLTDEYYLYIWYIRNNIVDYLNFLKDEVDIANLKNISESQIRFFHFICSEMNCQKDFVDLALYILENGSLSFDSANLIMSNFILPYLDDFSKEDFQRYCDINISNNQIYDRGRDDSDNQQIADKMREKNLDFNTFLQKSQESQARELGN